MAERIPTPKRGKREELEKITIWIPTRAKQIYDVGRKNRWNTPELLRRIVTEEIYAREAELVLPATDE